ncbi:MAG: hypothetical protein HKN47_19920 [Pirellulaceae bacterium]|nr:hypothetical protein [Pirellulaceae bacterium]
MTLALIAFSFCFAVAFVSFAILLPLEYHLRRSNWVTFPTLGVALRRTETNHDFDALRERAISQPSFCVNDIDANRFLVSTGSVRCMAERSTCGNRTALVFRYPLGLALFVVSVVAGVVLPVVLHAPFHMPNWEAAFGIVFMALFMGSLGSIFLLAFRSMANTDSDKLSYLLGLPLNAPDGFLFKRIPSSRKDRQPKNAQAETFEYSRTWTADVTDGLFAVIFVPALISGMVFFAIKIMPDASFFEYGFSAFIIIIGLVIWTQCLRQLPVNYRVHRDFTFSVTRDFIACECPSPTRGDSFTLFFQDIKEIRKEQGPNESERCVVIDRSGTAFEITGSYRNPVGRILDSIESISPTTPIFEFGIPRHAYTSRVG